MKTKTLFWQFFGVQIIILLAAISFMAFYTWRTTKQAFHRQWFRELEVQSRMVMALLPSPDGRLNPEEVRQFFIRMGHSEEHRFTMILPDGKVIGDTAADTATLDSHRDRPEIREALEKGRGVSQRYSASLGKQMFYLAQRIPAQGAAVAVIRVAVPERLMMRDIEISGRVLFLFVSLVCLASLLISYWQSGRIIGPVAGLQTGLQRIGEGELSFRMAIPSVPHLARLARAINQTAERLEKYIREVDDERNLRALILANMTRGVIAVDRDRRVMDINESARRLLDIERQPAEGTAIGEVARMPVLLALIEESERQAGPAEREIAAGDEGERMLNIRATELKDRSGLRIGTLLVLSDITLLRKLETVRQDFVANVSHELRTPVTSIKGFTETLLEGAKDDPVACERFLKIIMRQANQLDSIIHDLLELSRLEQNFSQNLDKPLTPVAGILKNAVELCQDRANERHVQLMIACEPDVKAPLHSGLMEQVLVNLIDNAVKYGATPECPRVEVHVRQIGEELEIRIQDFGNGIEKQHVDRLFERFYRVDKGRSRDVGGTGLGLAIVKHVILLHHGSIHVESELGKGTTFIIRLPGAVEKCVSSLVR